MSAPDPAARPSGGPVAPPSGDTWTGLCPHDLPDGLAAWAARPDCGAIVSFDGNVRDHAEGRTGVESLTYEAYAEVAGRRLEEIAAAARSRWPSLGRLAMLHRVGRLHVGEAAVRVVVSAPHRGEAFDAARWCIDTVKSSVPIWKHEAWADGSGWGTGSVPITDPVAIPTGSVLR
ncbi:MAG TPA: molybdenum cofactor biosynthesis protein MoaE [Acidimicrobiales bacterium]|nr:molybdenum cofactor biosynthesis protein MoaE [Acidimicrobiales bacterium]